MEIRDLYKIQKADHYMLDLETLSQSSRAAIISAGLVKFDPFVIQESFKSSPYFYQVVDKHSCTRIGMEIDDGTLKWWQKQSGYAQRILDPANANPPIEDVKDIMSTLRDISHFIKSNAETKTIYVWSNGASFDIPILCQAYELHGLAVPWKFSGDSCYRTINNITKLLGIKVDKEFKGTPHHSGHDAINQCLFLQKMLNALLVK